MNEFIQDEIFEELVEEGVEYFVVFGTAFIVLWLIAKPFLPILFHDDILPEEAGS